MNIKKISILLGFLYISNCYGASWYLDERNNLRNDGISDLLIHQNEKKREFSFFINKKN